ncbi:hypothetical protein D770_11200 [Flammeovirgaceae bacterium 311]|nr:hypothetical protein D770_11200 [Flammeovirgaceae bacterium 311]
MRKVILIVLLALLYANPSVAQTDSLKREIGFSTQIIFDNIFESSGSPVELMLKKRTGENKWMRYGLGLTGSHHDNAYTRNGNFKTSSTYLSISPSVGIEHRNPLLKKWHILYGGDLSLNYNYSTSTQISEDNNTSVEVSNSTYNAGAGLRPFLGLAYNITPRFYVSTEAFANISTYFGQNRHQRKQTYENIDNSANRWGFDVNVRPASAIFVYYRF